MREVLSMSTSSNGTPQAHALQTLAQRQQAYARMVYLALLVCYPLLALMDWRVTPQPHLQLMLGLRLSFFAIAVATVLLTPRLKLPQELPLHVAFGGLITHSALMASWLSPPELRLYALVFCLVFVLFNLLVLWPGQHSFFEMLLGIGLLLLFRAIGLSALPWADWLRSVGLLILLTVPLATLLGAFRYELALKDSENEALKQAARLARKEPTKPVEHEHTPVE